MKRVAFADRGVGGTKANVSAIWQRVHRIEPEIDQEQLDLTVIAIDCPQIFGQRMFKGDHLWNSTSQEFADLLNLVIQVQGQKNRPDVATHMQELGG